MVDWKIEKTKDYIEILKSFTEATCLLQFFFNFQASYLLHHQTAAAAAAAAAAVAAANGNNRNRDSPERNGTPNRFNMR
jgi:hypothetical protein